MLNILLEHFARYPQMGAQDAVKLLYQSEFAGGHLIDDPSASLLWLEEEDQRIEAKDTPLFTPIGGRLYRLDLGAAKAKGLSPHTINRCFVYTANRHIGSMENFRDKLNQLSSLCAQGALPITHHELEQYLASYTASGCPAVSHSAAYRELYSPHYRVVDKAFKEYWEVLCYIDGLLAANHRPISIAIEGNSASCKTSLSTLLQSIYDCNVIPMDHFFLQPHQRTAQRLLQPGGNIDYERFCSEVADKLPSAEGLVYRRYDCKAGSLQEAILLPPQPLTIIEGVYSMHPLYAHKYDGSIFLYTDRATQRARILARNGAEMLERFDKEWIPMEEAYFKAFSLKETCGLSLNTSYL